MGMQAEDEEEEEVNAVGEAADGKKTGDAGDADVGDGAPVPATDPVAADPPAEGADEDDDDGAAGAAAGAKKKKKKKSSSGGYPAESAQDPAGIGSAAGGNEDEEG